MSFVKDYTGMDISTQLHSRLAIKKSISVKVYFAPEPGILSTLEGMVPYERGDALLTGAVGDTWPVEREKFFHNYIPEPPTVLGQDGRYIKCPVQVWALQIHEPFIVRIRQGKAELRGSPGDWLVQYGPNDYGVVRADIFAQTYE